MTDPGVRASGFFIAYASGYLSISLEIQPFKDNLLK